MTTNDNNENDVICGEVKWFDTGRGFGFIRPDEGDYDIFLHVNVLREFGQSSIAEDTRLEIEIANTGRGYQAVKILSLLRAPQTEGPVLPELAGLTEDAVELLPFLPARLKWFDRAKGFGFATLFGDERDAFLHVDVVRKSGMEHPTTGEALALRVMKGKRGLIAVDVMAWDHLPAQMEL